MRPRFFLIVSLLAALLTGLCRPLSAADELTEFRRVLILENGRVKPLDSFARHVLLQISGRSSFAGESASAWLARVLFTPEKTYDDEIFLVDNPEVLDALGLEGRSRGRYTFAMLSPGLEKLQKLAEAALQAGDRRRSPVENGILRLYSAVSAYYQLSEAFRFVFRQPELTLTDGGVMAALGLSPDNNPFSYLDLYRRAGRMGELLAAARSRAAGEWTPTEQALLGLEETLRRQSARSAYPLLAILPLGGGEEHWLSPWEALAQQRASAAAFDLLEAAALAFRHGDVTGCDAQWRRFRETVQQPAVTAQTWRRAQREVFYNGVDPFFKAEILYGVALLLLLLSLLGWKRWLRRLCWAVLAAGMSLHLGGIVLRMLITGRPPVTNLYETFLFVGLIAAALGVAVEIWQSRHLGLATGALSGLIFLIIAGRYSADGDTMGMLTAVLDSNLWLATHVITITVGYAGCVVAGIIGHFYLVQGLRRGTEGARLATARALYSVLAFGLVFTFIGTVMGGIWADQSWGRFWGWDPKENGALVIILWAAVLFHARAGRLIGDVGMAAGAIGSIVTVVLAWFGVNLLGVGMHSYGFTSGVTLTLLVFVGLELLFLAVTLGLHLRRSRLPA